MFDHESLTRAGDDGVLGFVDEKVVHRAARARAAQESVIVEEEDAPGTEPGVEESAAQIHRLERVTIDMDEGEGTVGDPIARRIEIPLDHLNGGQIRDQRLDRLDRRRGQIVGTIDIDLGVHAKASRCVSSIKSHPQSSDDHEADVRSIEEPETGQQSTPIAHP